MQDDPDRDQRCTSATWTHEVTTNFELAAVRRRLPVVHSAIRSMPPEVIRKKCPSVLGIPQRDEELRLEATDRVGRRQEVVAHLGGIDDRSLCTREPHETQATSGPRHVQGLTAAVGFRSMRDQSSLLAATSVGPVASARRWLFATASRAAS